MEILVIKNYCTVMNYESRSLRRHIKDNREIIATKISASPRLTKCFTILVGTMLMSQKVLAKTGGDPLKMIDTTGAVFLGVVMRVGYRLILIMCAIEILKSLMQGDTKGVGKILIKYLSATLALYSFPWLMDLVIAACSR